MTEETVLIPKDSQLQMRRLQAELGNDLTAMMRLIQRDMLVVMRKAAREKWSVPKLLNELEGMKSLG